MVSFLQISGSFSLGTMISKSKSLILLIYLLYPDSPLSFAWVNSRSSKSQEAIPETESTQHSREAVNSKLNVSHEILELMTEGFTSEDGIGSNNYVGSGVCHKWNTSLPESKKTEENCEKDDHNKMQDSSQE